MKESPYILDIEEEEKVKESFDIKSLILKYFANWPWFLGALLLSLLISYIYLRYAPESYTTVAKIKILEDSKDMDIATDPLALLTGPKTNLDNEIEVLTSTLLLSQVVDELSLDVSYYEVGTIKSREEWNLPFQLKNNLEIDSIQDPLKYSISFTKTNIIINDHQIDETETIRLDRIDTHKNLPYSIILAENFDVDKIADLEYKIKVISKKEAVLQLVKDLDIRPTNKNSEVLSISLRGESPARTESILNKIVQAYSDDGIIDRQLESKRTIDFIDNRFVSLAEELDSIEVGKKDFKRLNNLSYIEADAGITMQQKSEAEARMFNLQTQIQVSKNLKRTIENKGDFSLLPADVGVENSSINGLVMDYNRTVLEREKLITSAGANNPLVRILSEQLQRGKQNIVNSVNGYQSQQRIALKQIQQERGRANNRFSKLPEDELQLRSINRQQNLKENLFLLLLQKREEEAISYAVTAPNIKIVDYAQTMIKPDSPKTLIVYAIALAMGLVLPFLFFYVKFMLDTKIYTRADIEKINIKIPVLAEIPRLENTVSLKNINDRSQGAEAFRILSSNANYMLPKTNKDVGNVIYITSTIKGEGKTITALNLAMAYTSMDKKVLLLGADLRNPQLHTYLDVKKESIGLSNYLLDSTMDWKDCVTNNVYSNKFLSTCLSGPLPPNPPQLLSGGGFEKLLTEAKKHYDYIIVDTAPTILVADTRLISKYADLTIFVTRSGLTEKKLLDFSIDFHNTKKLKNMAYIINDVQLNKSQSYNYGYGYGYGEEN